MHSALISFLDPANLIDGFGAYALIGVCAIIFAETGLLVGFIFPGDTLLILTGVLAVGTGGVNIFGLGTFEVRATKEKVGRNPKTGESIKIPAGRKVVFKAATGLKYKM